MKRALTYLLIQNLSLGEYDSSKRLERQYSYQTNVTREPVFVMWWLLFVHKKVTSIPNVARVRRRGGAAIIHPQGKIRIFIPGK